MYVGWVSGGSATVLDTWSTSKAQPSADGTNNVENIVGTESGSVTTISFSRKLVTGDSKDLDIKDQDVYLQWAYGR